MITDAPFAVACDELLRLDLFDEYCEHRAKIYSSVFEAWAQEHQQEIEDMNLNEDKFNLEKFTPSNYSSKESFLSKEDEPWH